MQRQSPENSAEVRQSIESALAKLPEGATRSQKSLLVARTLLLDHGVYPSAKVLHDFTQHGSLTDISRDLRAFWTELRDKSRVQLNAPFLPEELVSQMGEALGKIWGLANDQAQRDLEEKRAECESQVSLANGLAEASRIEKEKALALVRAHAEEAQAERERREVAEMRVLSQQAEIEGLSNSLVSWQNQANKESEARRESEIRFSRDLEAERMDRSREAERFAGEINFAKRQIEAARSELKEIRERSAAERTGRELEVASYRQRMNKAEELVAATKGELAEVRAQKQWLDGQVADLQERVKELAKVGVARIASRKPGKRTSLR